MQTQTITKSEAKILNELSSITEKQRVILAEIKRDLIDLSPRRIQSMIGEKIHDDLLKFRTCCADTIASR